MGKFASIPLMNGRRINLTIKKLILYIVLYSSMIGLTFVFLYPFIYMLVTACKSPADLNDMSVTWLINGIHFNNFKTAFKALDYTPRLKNTLFVVLLSVLGHVLSCSFIGYGFARYEFRFKKIWFALLILAIIIPTETIIVPIYIFFSRIGFIGSYLPIILPCFLGFGLRGALFIFVFNQFFLSLPKALEEAAAIDGAGPVRTFFSIALPNAKASSLICIVLGVVWHWNDTFEPSMYIENQSRYLLPQMLPNLYRMVSNEVSVDSLLNNTAEIYNDAVAMAATAMVIIPLILFYIFIQSRFMVSVERSGITG